MKLPDCIKTEENVPFIKGRWMAFCYPELPNDIHGAGACEETAISDLLDKIDNRRLENLTMEVVNRNLDLVPTWASDLDLSQNDLSQRVDSKVMKELVKDIIKRINSDQPDLSSVPATLDINESPEPDFVA